MTGTCCAPCIAAVCLAVAGSAVAQPDPSSLGASEAAVKIRNGELTSEALTRALIGRAKAGKALNAFVTLDETGALKAAKAADARAKAGQWRGALHGVPVVIKDNIHVANLPNTAGTPGLREFVPKQPAPVVKRLVDAGAIVLGKTNMHELAMGVTSNNRTFGAVGNPYNPKHIAGGSSGGTGAAIAARMSPAGLGTDTGGSVRIPAALCGITGLRPTLGRYPQEGITPLSHTRDTAGPMARSVADLVLLDSVISGAKDAVNPAELKGVRLGVPRALYSDLEPETARLAEAALAKLERSGVELIEADVPKLLELNSKVSSAVSRYEIARDLPLYLQQYRTRIEFPELVAELASPDVSDFLKALLLKNAPARVSTAMYQEAIKVHRPNLKAAYADYFRAQRVTAIAFPTCPLPAAPIGDDKETELNGKKVPTFLTFVRNTSPGSNAGIPGLSIPIGLSRSGLPIGLELDGPAGSDRRLLAIGLALEKLFPPLPPPNSLRQTTAE